MKTKFGLTFWSAHVTNVIIGLVGAVVILMAIILGVQKTISVVMLSVGTSILASAIVSSLSAHYMLQQSNAVHTIERWGLDTSSVHPILEGTGNYGIFKIILR